MTRGYRIVVEVSDRLAATSTGQHGPSERASFCIPAVPRRAVAGQAVKPAPIKKYAGVAARLRWWWRITCAKDAAIDPRGEGIAMAKFFAPSRAAPTPSAPPWPDPLILPSPPGSGRAVRTGSTYGEPVVPFSMDHAWNRGLRDGNRGPGYSSGVSSLSRQSGDAKRGRLVVTVRKISRTSLCSVDPKRLENNYQRSWTLSTRSPVEEESQSHYGYITLRPRDTTPLLLARPSSNPSWANVHRWTP